MMKKRSVWIVFLFLMGLGWILMQHAQPARAWMQQLRHEPLIQQAQQRLDHALVRLGLPMRQGSSPVLSEQTLMHYRRQFVSALPRQRADLPPEDQILLVSRRIETTGGGVVQSSTSSIQPTKRGTRLYIVQFGEAITEQTRAVLHRVGAIEHGYIPHQALLLELTPAQSEQLSQAAQTKAVVEVAQSDKVQPFLTYLSTRETGSVNTVIEPLCQDDISDVVAAIDACGGAVETVDGLIRATLPLRAIQSLVSRADVVWVETAFRNKRMMDLAHASNHLNTQPVWNPWGLTGKGQIAATSDSGVDTGVPGSIHPDLNPNVIHVLSLDSRTTGADAYAHGTHTAGLIVGNGTASAGKYKGAAPGASLICQAVYVDGDGNFYGLPGDLGGLFQPTYTNGARIHSASWGSANYGEYTSEVKFLDQYVYDHPDFLPVFAAGNDGIDANSNGVVDAHSICTPGTAKNVVTVGASESDRPANTGGYSGYRNYVFGGFPVNPLYNDYISTSADGIHQGIFAISSRGPVNDGRIKPDVVAPGTDVISLRSSLAPVGNTWGAVAGYDNRYCFMGGTSMATPLIAGGALLMRQYAVERAGIAAPSAALIKAMLVGGAQTLAPGQHGTGAYREIPATSPNSVEGWGQPNFAQTVHPSSQMVRLYDRITLSNRATNKYDVVLAKSNMPLRVTLVWVDYPSTTLASINCVNDYDLRVVTPSGTVVYPNGGSAADTLNTVETVTIPAATQGTYRVEVVARNVIYEEGGAVALYVRGAFEAPAVIVHTPPTGLPLSLQPIVLDYQMQSLSVCTQGETSVRYTYGTASGPTGSWATVASSYVSNSLYRANVPQPAHAATLYYAIRGPSTNGLSVSTTNFAVYVGSAVQFVVAGNPQNYGTVTPAYGTNWLTMNVSREISAPATVSVDATQRVRCQGYVGSGDIPFFGLTNAVTVALTQASSITWAWKKQYALTQNLSVPLFSYTERLATTWHDENTQATTTQAPELLVDGNGAFYALSGWIIDGVRYPDNPLRSITMSGAKTADATYLPYFQDSDSDGISDWWALRYFNTTTVERWGDPDGDGWINWDEYDDNTDPFDNNSVPTPPEITVHPLTGLQQAHPPWTVSATVTDNFSVQEVYLVWQEAGDSTWQTTAMNWVSNDVYSASFTPPNVGAKRVEYYVMAFDVLGINLGYAFGSESDSYYVLGDYSEPWAQLLPSSNQIVPFVTTSTSTTCTFRVNNRAGPDLDWQLRTVPRTAVLSQDWQADSPWVQTTNRTPHGYAVWYCGDPVARAYADGTYAHLISSACVVPSQAVLIVQQWISTELNSAIPGEAWDGGVVSISVDDGATWQPLTPQSGYPYQITDNVDSPFAAQTPCLAGDGSAGWEILQFSLAAYAGQSVRTRFSFGADLATTAEGWYVAEPELYSLASAQVEATGSLRAMQGADVPVVVDPATLIPHEEKGLLVELSGNMDIPLVVPVYLRKGNTLSLRVDGNGTVAAEYTFLFAPWNSPMISAQAAPYYHVSTVQSVGGSAFTWAANLPEIAMTLGNLRQDTTVTVTIAANVTPTHSTPEWWLAQFGVSSNFDSQAESDLDNDGLYTWQEFLTGTDPLNRASRLQVLGVSNSVVRWTGGTNALQYLQFTASLTSPWQTVFTNLPPTALTNAYEHIKTNTPSGFYRVVVP